MNDEKTAVINMVSDGTLTSSEGLALFEALCDLEDIGSCEADVEVEASRYLPPWESEESGLFDLFFENRCTRAIVSTNQEIISVLQAGKLSDIPRRIGLLDVVQLSRFKLRPRAALLPTVPGQQVAISLARPIGKSSGTATGGLAERGWQFCP